MYANTLSQSNIIYTLYNNTHNNQNSTLNSNMHNGLKCTTQHHDVYTNLHEAVDSWLHYGSDSC